MMELEALNLKPFPYTTNEVRRLAATDLPAAQRLQDEEIMLYGVAGGELAFCCCCWWWCVVIDMSDGLRFGKWAVGSEEGVQRDDEVKPPTDAANRLLKTATHPPNETQVST